MAALIGKTHFSRFSLNVVTFTLKQRKCGLSWSGLQYVRRISSSRVHCAFTNQDSRDPGPIFISPEVQRLLERVTCLDVDKTFRTRLGRISNPAYKLLTKDELDELKKATIEKAREHLQMPPVLKVRNEDSVVISEDPEIDQFETDGTKYIFTDITFGLPNKSRSMVIREQNGTLRHASPTERDRYLDVYYPRPGKMYSVPKMLRENLQSQLEEHKYEYVLDRACLQFEPDEAEFTDITQRVYEHVAQEKRFEDLRSTRHFGPLTFYFVFYRNMDALLLDMLDRNLLDNAGDLIRLYHIIHPDCDSIKSVNKETDSLQLVKAYSNSKDTKKPGEIQLSLQALSEHMIRAESF